MFSVSELTPALECIKEELEKLGLLDGAHIAWRDPREEVWRVWYSKSARFESPSGEDFAIERQLLDDVLSAAQTCLCVLKKLKHEPSGQ